MAGKGTYAAYQQQPQVTQGFAGESQLARMAERVFQKRKEERDSQRKILASSDEAIINAEMAANINPLEYKDKLQSTVYRMLDAYKSDLLDATKKAKANPSFENNLAIKKLQSQFEGNLNTIKGIGNTMNNLSANRGNYDEIMSMDGYNGLSKFTAELLPMLDEIDPRTLSVNGENIAQKFSRDVDVTKFVPKINDDAIVDDFVTGALGSPKKITYDNEKTGKSWAKQEYDQYNENVARKNFKEDIVGSQEYDKLTRKILLKGKSMEQNGEDLNAINEFYAKYTTGTKGNEYVSPDNLFDYIRDSYIEPQLNKTVSEGTTISQPRPITPSSAQLSAIEDLRKEMANFLAVKDYVYDGKGAEGFSGQYTKMGGRDVRIGDAGYKYDPISGETNFIVDYKMIDPEGRVDQVTNSIVLGENPAEELGKILYGMDFRTSAQKLGFNMEGSQTYTPTLDDRATSIQNKIDNNSQAILSYVSPIDDVNDLQDVLFGDNGSAIGMADDDVINTVKSLLKDPTMLRDAWFGGDKYADLGSVTYDLSDEADKKAISEKISMMIIAGQQAKNRKEDVKSVVNNIASQDNKFNTIKYELDPVQKYINENPAEEQYKLRELANSKIKAGASDEEVLSTLKNAPKIISEEDKAYKALNGKYGNSYNVDADIERFLNNNPDASKLEAIQQLEKIYQNK